MEDSITTSNKKINNDFFNLDFKKSNRFYTRTYHHKLDLRASESQTNDEWSIKSLSKQAVSTEFIDDDPITLGVDGEITFEPKAQSEINYEDSENLVDTIFRGRDFISSESWHSNEIIKSRIVSADDNFVYLDCIVDVEKRLIEHRQFHKNLFLNFKTIETGDFALVKIKTKPGSVRIDVYPGNGMVSSELFEINDAIQDLKGKSLGTKLRKW